VFCIIFFAEKKRMKKLQSTNITAAVPSEEDVLEKFRAHLIDGVPLAPRHMETLVKYRKAHSILCLGYSPEHCRTLIQKEFELSESHSYMILRNSIKLYGDVVDIDKKGVKYIMYENYMNAANLARKAEDYASMISALDKACKLLDLYNSNNNGTNPLDYAKPVAIIFTTDANVLKTEQKTEDISHEDLQ
jgi:hypothetical protein